MRLRIMRYARELDADEVAKMIGVSKSTIIQIEGRNKEFSCVPKIIKLYEKTPIPEPLEKIIGELLEKKIITRNQIARDTGISRISIRKLLRGETLRFKKMRKIRDYLKTLPYKEDIGTHKLPYQ